MLASSAAALLLGAGVALAATAAAAGPNPLDVHRGVARVLLVSAPAETDPDLRSQRRIFDAARAGALDRDLVLVEAVGEAGDARRLRTAFGLDPAAFRVVLIGKDGGAKLQSAHPLGPEQLWPVIDAMPMRQSEMRRRPR